MADAAEPEARVQPNVENPVAPDLSLPPPANHPEAIRYTVEFGTKYAIGLKAAPKRRKKMANTSFTLLETASWDAFKRALFRHLSAKYNTRIDFSSRILESGFGVSGYVPKGHELLGDDTGATYTDVLLPAACKKRAVLIVLTQTLPGTLKRAAADDDIDDRPAVRRRIGDAAGEGGPMLRAEAEQGEMAGVRAGVNEGEFAAAAAAFGIGGDVVAGVIGGRLGGRGGHANQGIPRGRGGAVGNAPGRHAAPAAPAGGGGARQGFAAEREGIEEDVERLEEDDVGPEEDDPEMQRRTRMATMFDEIRRNWACSSPTCPNRNKHCWVNPRDSKHIALLNPQLRVWVEAIMNTQPDITTLKPPNHLYFDPEAAQNQVVERAHQIRGRNQQENIPPPPQPIVIHNYLNDQLNAAPVNRQPLAPVHPAAALLGKQKLPLDAFCERYGLSAEIQRVARELRITSSHSFYLLTMDHLTTSFQPGEVADIEFAKQEWLNGE